MKEIREIKYYLVPCIGFGYLGKTIKVERGSLEMTSLLIGFLEISKSVLTLDEVNPLTNVENINNSEVNLNSPDNRDVDIKDIGDSKVNVK